MENQKIIESLWDLHDKYEDTEHEICGDAAECITAYNKSGLTPEEINALTAELDTLKSKKHEYHISNERLIKSNNQLLHENSKLKSELSDNAIAMTAMWGQKQQVESERDTLKKALEIASAEANKLFGQLELFGLVKADRKASCIQDNINVWIQQAQEQEGKP